MRKILPLLLCWMMSGGVLAQKQGVGTADELSVQVAQVEQRIVQIRALGKHLDAVLEADREAILYRRDTQGFALMRDLDKLARAVTQLPEDNPQRLEMIRRLSSEFSGLIEAVFERSNDLSERIAHYTEQAAQESGTAKLVTQAYINNLKNLRIQSYETAADVIDGRSTLGLPVDGLRENLSQHLYLLAETLVGKLSYTGSAGRAMGERLKEDPGNAELDAATRAMVVKHSQGRQRLELVSALLGRMGLENVVYKTELLQQGQEFSIRDFEKDVFVRLLEESWKSLKVGITTQAPDFAFRALTFLLIVMVFRALARLVRRLVIAACERSGADMSILLKDVLASVSGGSVTLMGLLIALSQVGISVGPMLAGLGVAGFIVGFALQDTLGNFAAGGMILIYRPYDVDDFVEVVGASGLVKKMSLVSTTITTFDNQTLVVPNSKIWGDVIKNVTAQKVRRVDLEFGISYSDDVEHVERVLCDIVETHEMVLDKPEPLIKLHSLGDSSVNFIVRPWVKTGDYWSVYWDLTREIKLRFDREGISIPFPQADVHVYRENG